MVGVAPCMKKVIVVVGGHDNAIHAKAVLVWHLDNHAKHLFSLPLFNIVPTEAICTTLPNPAPPATNKVKDRSEHLCAESGIILS